MKSINKIGLVLIVISMSFIAACKKNLQPYSSKSSSGALASVGDIQIATYGNYSILKTRNYTHYFMQLDEYAGDNVAASGADGDPGALAYYYTHIPNMNPTAAFWEASYKLIHGANLIIERIKDGESKELDQLKGENIYLRAMAHFHLVCLFGRPYPQGEGDNLGIPIINKSVTDSLPKRNTVKEVYNFVISDLLKAESLMTIHKNCNFASKEVAEALLSRVYLYEGENQKAIDYADKVINSNYYSLASTEVFKKSPTLNPENNPEIIFNFRHTVADDQGKSSMGSNYYNDPVTQSTGWGEYYASLSYMNLLDQYPEDARHAFITPHIINGVLQYRGISPQYYINKYSWQDGNVNLSSPTFLRLAEMYLNKAEANAKLGNDQLAIDDVNLIRKRAGLSGLELYSVDDLKGRKSVLDVVLEERRLELAFEGHRRIDLFRNNRPLIRDYPLQSGPDLLHFRVDPSDPRVVFYIPEREITVNPNLIQNP